ncbi:hypothetical protein KBB96_17670 [Luteolibacter ambystomatis]|uniref:Uncharacterized protein n=1 Tax=Luteolibacter ambystomatis TaxID=2824561 RepID=A0A975G8I6_9BACT|nr:hypothetical protein [Luteolibacter ambystomatis]QUE50675.1 hypothetical protein KBB96_17670 [Luteolibacter ambystomatis]
MKNAIIASLALGVTALTSCTYDAYPGGPGPGYPGGGYPGGGYPGGGYPGGGAQASQAYRLGQSDGARDKRAGRGYNPTRGQYSVAAPFRDNYRSGYSSGFRSVSGGGGWGGGSGGGWGGGGYPGGGGSHMNVYRAGYSAGMSDRRRGLGYNSARHWGSVPSGDHAEFNRGYAAGWAASR